MRERNTLTRHATPVSDGSGKCSSGSWDDVVTDGDAEDETSFQSLTHNSHQTKYYYYCTVSQKKGPRHYRL